MLLQALAAAASTLAAVHTWSVSGRSVSLCTAFGYIGYGHVSSLVLDTLDTYLPSSCWTLGPRKPIRIPECVLCFSRGGWTSSLARKKLEVQDVGFLWR